MINLHVHTKHSWDSLSSIDEIIKFAKENSQNAIAITDHGNMAGAMEFYLKAKKSDIKPIIGCEFYICQNGKSASLKSSENRKLNHLVVLAKNLVGYKNLLKLTKIAAENFYYDPRIDEEILFNHSDGLIVINGHMNTSLNECLFYNTEALYSCETIECARDYLFPDYKEKFWAIASRYKAVFGDDFYVEVQLFDKGDIGQQAAGHFLIELADEFGIKPVATGDAHYVNPKDARFHKTFCAIKQNKKIRDLPDIRYYTEPVYSLIDNSWAHACYPTRLIDEAHSIANKIEFYDITYDTAIPQSDVSKVADPKEYLLKYCTEELVKRNLYTSEYVDRLNYELEILTLGNLFDYFLIVEDYVKYAINNDILVGPSRGSAGGCLVSYLLDIISIDPIKYDLSFDRFFSKDKALSKTLPDIDSDFPTSQQQIVIDYIVEKYGRDKVCGVVTRMTEQGKNALKDVLRVYSACDFAQMNKITDLIPKRDKISDKLADFKEETGSDSIIYYCLKKEPELLADYCILQTVNGEDVFSGEYAIYFELAIGIEGGIKALSKHPSAIIISKHNIVDVAPLILDRSSGEMIVDYDMNNFPYAGLVKFDILRLKSLDCLTEVNNLLKEIGICI